MSVMEGSSSSKSDGGKKEDDDMKVEGRSLKRKRDDNDNEVGESSDTNGNDIGAL